MRNHREILRLYRLKFSYEDIATSCNCSKSTVSRTIDRFQKANLSWDTLKTLTDEELSRILFPRTPHEFSYQMPNFEDIERELSRPGVTLQLVWMEYCERCQDANLHAYKYTQFRKYYYDYVHKTKATMHIEHKMGDIMEVDWAGTTLSVTNCISGESEKAYVFVAVLPFSGYTYAEAFLSMKENDWITAHIHAYQYFGGVTRVLVPDNLKTGVVKNTKSETVINPTYLEMGDHYETAIIPARPRSPKDKATVEGTVGKITNNILAPIRNRQYFSLVELNDDIATLLKEFNDKPFQKKEGSRSTLFEEERRMLRPLPPNNFEMAEWKQATVQYNYHVTVYGKNYSCPYQYIHKVVNVRITTKTIEIFYAGTRIAAHLRLPTEAGNYSTLYEHMPPDHQQHSRWNGDHFRRWAKTIGESTSAVIDYFLTSNRVEEQGYKSCMCLLSMANSHPHNKIEEACKICRSRTYHPTLHAIKLILNTEMKEEVTTLSSYGISRGPEYYSQDGD